MRIHNHVGEVNEVGAKPRRQQPRLLFRVDDSDERLAFLAI
jgi:hypothetical protein